MHPFEQRANKLPLKVKRIQPENILLLGDLEIGQPACGKVVFSHRFSSITAWRSQMKSLLEQTLQCHCLTISSLIVAYASRIFRLRWNSGHSSSEIRPFNTTMTVLPS